MVAKFALSLALSCAPMWFAQASSLEQELEGSIPVEAWEATACSADDGSEDCQLHLLQLRARGLATANATADATVRAKQSGPEAQNVSTFSAGHCTEGEHAKMSALGGGHEENSWPYLVASCAKKALRWLKMHRDDMTECISTRLGISMACAGCYSYIGEYGYKHCKAQCVFSKWCGSGCLDCTKKSYPSVDQCAGFVAPFPTTC